MHQAFLFGGLAIVANILDSVSTRLCLSLPQTTKGREGNPLMAFFMDGDYLIAEIIKHLSVGILVAFWIYMENTRYLLSAAVLFGLVVINNSYIYLTSRIFKRKLPTIMTSFTMLVKRYKLPSLLEYVIVVGILMTLTYFIVNYITGVSEWS